MTEDHRQSHEGSPYFMFGSDVLTGCTPCLCTCSLLLFEPCHGWIHSSGRKRSLIRVCRPRNVPPQYPCATQLDPYRDSWNRNRRPVETIEPNGLSRKDVAAGTIPRNRRRPRLRQASSGLMPWRLSQKGPCPGGWGPPSGARSTRWWCTWMAKRFPTRARRATPNSRMASTFRQIRADAWHATPRPLRSHMARMEACSTWAAGAARSRYPSGGPCEGTRTSCVKHLAKLRRFKL